MKFLVDRCAGRSVCRWLSARGHDVLDARALGKDPGDLALLRTAEEQGRILISIDKDFGRLVLVQNEVHCGLIRLPDATPDEKDGFLEDVLATFKEEDLHKSMVTVDSSGRIRARTVRSYCLYVVNDENLAIMMATYGGLAEALFDAFHEAVELLAPLTGRFGLSGFSGQSHLRRQEGGQRVMIELSGVRINDSWAIGLTLAAIEIAVRKVTGTRAGLPDSWDRLLDANEATSWRDRFLSAAGS